MRPLRLALVVSVFVFASLPVLAHHPFESTFDWKQPISLSGVVTSVDWSAPHVRIHLQVFEYWGPPDNYVLELGSPSALARSGWRKASVIIGDEIRVDGWLAHDGARLISVKTVTTVDGREYFGASSFFDGYGVCVSGDYCGDEEEGDFEEYCGS